MATSVSKVKFTEEYLLVITKCRSLSEIEELNLSELSLTNNDLMPSLFNKLTNLIEINLSGNKLKCIPKDISWSKLQYLNISKNCLIDVEWLSRFENLKEVDIFDNVGLNVCDSYKVMFLLKNLQFLDGKRVDQDKIGKKFTTELLNRMNKLWFAQFESLWKNIHNTKQKKSLLKEFLNLSLEKIQFGPNSLRDFRRWRIQSIAQDFLNLKNVDPSACLTHLLDQNLMNVLDKDVIKNKTKKLHYKHMLGDISNNENQITNKKQKIGLNFNPIVFLQCHSANEDPDDFATQVWCCEFEPNISNSSKYTTTSTVATCGGSSVCIINCETVKVMFRFDQKNEEFYTLSWTSILINSNQTNILVVGGCLGYLYLIHVNQSICYGKIKYHSSPIQTIRFITHTNTHLLSADGKGNIHLIDIGIPLIPEYQFDCKKLMTFSGLDSAPIRLLIKSNILLCGSEAGLYCWSTPNLFNNKPLNFHSLNLNCQLTFPNVEHQMMVDALELVNEDIVATKCPQESVIFLWRLSDLCYKLSISKKVKKPKLTIELLAKFSWSNTIQCFINFVVNFNPKVLLCGDEVGNIWVYDTSSVIQLTAKNTHQCPCLSPMLVVPFPSLVISNKSTNNNFLHNKKTIFNDINCNSDLQYVVVVADNNLVGIYKKS